MVCQDRSETNLLQLFAQQENSEWFSIIYHFCYHLGGQYCCWTETKISV